MKLNFKMLITLTALIATALSAALPQSGVDTPTTGGVGPVVPESVEVMYYQQPWNLTSESCGTIVSNGTLTSNTCTRLCTVGISVLQVREADCLFTVYKGTQTCTNPSEIVSYAIGKGEGGMVCVNVGVYNGCEGAAVGHLETASGMWSCG